MSSSDLDPVTGLPAHTTVNPDDAPVLPPATPATTSLSNAVGIAPPPPRPKDKAGKAKKRRDDDGDDEDPRHLRLHWVVAGAIVVGITIVTLIFLGRENGSHYYVQCDADRIVATRGRSFPPWGTTALSGAEWKTIAIAPNDECTALDTDSLATVEDYFLKVLMRQASALLQAREVTKPDVAAEQLNQALLLARSEARRPQRRDIERLLGDVEYWRASAHLKEASAALLEASKQFDAAAAQQPRHVADAASWAKYIRRLVDELHAGPDAKSPTTSSASDPAEPASPRGAAPTGTALPVSPGSTRTAPAAAPPDAGTPGGGVLM